VTTLALALASVWPRPLALVELDPAGGDLALRLTDTGGRPLLRPEPGLLTLAASLRHDDMAGGGRVWDHGQPLPLSRRSASANSTVTSPIVLPGLDSGEQGAGMAALWPAVARALAETADGDVLADLGRTQGGSPATAVAAEADVLVGVARANADAMLRLRERIAHLLRSLPTPPNRPRRMKVVLVADDRRGPEAVDAMRTMLARAQLAADVAGFTALDPAAVDALVAGQAGARLDRSLLMRTTRAIIPKLLAPDVGCVPPDGEPTVDPTPRRSLARSR
jgi:hypothetical protein